MPEDKYLDCCRNEKNWEYCYGEIVCNKCGRILPEEVVAVIILE